MKILQVIPVFYPATAFGGAANVVYNISKELAKKGHDVTVYTTNAFDQKRNFRLNYQEHMIDGFKVHYFRNTFRPYGLYVSLGFFFALEKKVMTFDVIHIHAWRQFWQDIITHHYAVKCKIPYLLQVCGALPRTMTKQNVKLIYDLLFGYRLLADASKVISLSQIEAEQYKRMGVPEEKIVVIPAGIDLSEYANLPSKGAFKKKFGIKENEKIILYLGRIHIDKGIDFLVKSFAYLAKKGVENVKLVIAGPDYGFLTETKRLVTSLKISDNVVFTGMLSESQKISAYVDASIVVNVEPKNVFGLVPLEAAACSTPVVVSKGNAISNIVRQGKFGFSVKYGDIPELTGIINEMLDSSDLLREKGRRGRRFVFENHNWANIVGKFENVYKEIAHTKQWGIPP